MKSPWFGFALLLISILAAGCQAGSDQPALTGTPAETVPPAASPPQEESDLPASRLLSQWGVSAEASSEFANPEWSAAQAVGSPDAPGCGDYQFAWASAASDGIETLVVSFPRAVYPLEIEIHQSFNPDQVVKVEVFDSASSAYYTVLQKNPVPVDRPCPYLLEIAVEGIDFKTDQVRITVDQSQLGLGWNEIDAVRLVGSLNQPGE